MAPKLKVTLRPTTATKPAPTESESSTGTVAPAPTQSGPVAGLAATTIAPEDAAQPSALTSAEAMRKAAQDAKQAANNQVSIGTSANKLPSLKGAMSRLKVSQEVAEKQAVAAAKHVETPLPKPVDPTLKSAGELSLIARAKALKETGEQYQSVFPDAPWPESELEGFDAQSHLDDLKLLEKALLEDEELLPFLMARVHQNLRQYDDLAHILNEEQIQVIVCAFAKRKDIEIVAAATGKGTKGGGTKGRTVQSITKDLSIEQVMSML